MNNFRLCRSTSLSSNEDLLDLLLSAVDSQEQPFNDQEIKDQTLTFVLAGHATTGNLMTWTMYVLMAHAKILEVCREEVYRVLPNDIKPTNEHYISSEGHRQILIPAGATVLLNSYIFHRREDYWPRRNEFDYTRWIRDPVTGLKPKLAHPFCYLPFAAGPRNCIGQNFALLEAKVMLAMLVQRCNFEIEPGQKIVTDVRVTM